MFLCQLKKILFCFVLLSCSNLTLVRADELTRNTAVEGDASVQESLLRYTNRAQDVVLKALELVGIHYRRGGANPDTGLDCSGFVQVVFKESLGKLLPRTAREQSEVGDTVDKAELKPGDLVFFNTMRRAQAQKSALKIWAGLIGASVITALAGLANARPCK